MTGKDGQSARLVLQGSGMTEEEVEARLKELETLKLHPRDQEGPRAIIAQAQRLYAMTVGGVRDRVGEMLDWFQGEIAAQEPIRVAKASRRARAFFDQVEAYLGVGDLPPQDLDPLSDSGEEG